MRRLWWLLRVAFHDWMWEAPRTAPRLRALAQRLPLYFSDPYWMSAAEFDRIVAEDGLHFEPTRGPGLSVQPPWRIVPSESTWSGGASHTIKYAPEENR